MLDFLSKFGLKPYKKQVVVHGFIRPRPTPKPRAEGSSPSAPAIKRYQKRCNAEKARFIGLFLLPLSRILFYKIVDVFIVFLKL